MSILSQRHNAAGARVALTLVALSIALSGCTPAGGDGSATAAVAREEPGTSAPEVVAPPEFPEAQRMFHGLNRDCREKFRQGETELQRSLVFNECNAERYAFAREHSIHNWTGRISSIQTDQGADVVALAIEADLEDMELIFRTRNSRASDLGHGTMLRPGQPVYEALVPMKKGDKVSFDAEFLVQSSDRPRLIDGALTERGSMREPEFTVRFSGLRPFGTQVLAQQETAEALPTGAEKAAPDDMRAWCAELKRESDQGTLSENGSTQYLRHCLDFEPEEHSAQAVEVNPSFDCAKATTRVELLICGSARLAALDVELASEYGRARGSASDKTALRDAQNAWRKGRRDACEDAACVEAAYQQRLDELRR